jgi:hypothetical protein
VNRLSYDVIISASDATIGIDWGNTDKVETVPAAKSVSFPCKEGRHRALVLLPDGVRTDEISTDGCSLVTVGETDSETLVD